MYTRWLFIPLLAACTTLPPPAPGPAEECYGASCETPEIVRPRSIELADEDLELIFPPGVQREQALRFVAQCYAVDPEDNPNLARLECPVRFGPTTVDVAEGPAGTSLMLRIGNRSQSEALRRWMEEKMPQWGGGRAP